MSLTKVNKDPFSNGTECDWWMERNCYKCVKQGHLNADESKYILKCAIYRDIEVRMMSDEPIAQRTIDICRLDDCPYRQEHWPKRKRKSKTAGLPQLFKEEWL